MRKPKSTDTILRLLAILQAIPVYPKTISTTEIRNKIAAQNAEYDVDARTIQRNLELLSDSFPLGSESVGRNNHWFWIREHEFTQIPAMDKATAFAFKLAAENLKALVPPSTLKLLTPYFKHASGVLQQSKLGSWNAKTRIVGADRSMIVPTIKPKVQEVVYDGLLDDKQIEVDYRNKARADSKSLTLNPLGIVLKRGIIYLVATSWDYTDPRHYALHRMHNAKLLKQSAKRPADFDLGVYVEQAKEFSYPVSDDEIKLRALFTKAAGVAFD